MDSFSFFVLVLAAVTAILFIASRGSSEARKNEQARRQMQDIATQKMHKKQREAEELVKNQIEMERIERDKKFKEQAEKMRAEKLLAAEQDDEKRKAEEKAEADLKEKISKLKKQLPFYISSTTPSDEYKEQDQRNWDEVFDLIKENNVTPATLYFVKIRSLLDDNEYYKIGITTKGIDERFEKSTQVELIEIIDQFDTDLYKAAFLEYYFLREFRLFDGLSETLDDIKPLAKFSGYTEVVRSNSTNKISTFFKKLAIYNAVD